MQCRKGFSALAKRGPIIYLTKDLYPEYVFDSFQTRRSRKQTTQYFKAAKDLNGHNMKKNIYIYIYIYIYIDDK